MSKNAKKFQETKIGQYFKQVLDDLNNVSSNETTEEITETDSSETAKAAKPTAKEQTKTVPETNA